MADTHPVDTPDATPEIERRPLWQRILKWIGVAILALVFLVVAIVVGINTDPGRRGSDRRLYDRIGAQHPRGADRWVAIRSYAAVECAGQ